MINKTIVLKIISILSIVYLVIWQNFSVEKKSDIAVLMYHNVSNNILGLKKWFVSPKEFDKQMKYLYENNYKTYLAEEINEIKKNEKSVIITFDDGYENFYTEVFSILKKYNIKANLYVATDYIGQKNYVTEEQLKEMDNSGLVSIGSHTCSHVSLTDLGPNELEHELKNSQIKLEKILNKKIKTIAYPNGHYDETTLKKVKKYYDYGFIFGDMLQKKSNIKNHEINRIGIYYDIDFETFKSIIKSL